jgi:hypothetical protein
VDFLEAHKQESHHQLQQLIGATLGRLHLIVRGYDGWVDQAAPYPIDWKAAFFQSLDHKLRAAQQLNSYLTQHTAPIERFIARHERIWSTPTEFVFSEFTGFQGMATCLDDRWRLTGIIDIEDHRFVDQRYVLAGHELFMTFGGGVLPPAFWDGYTEHKSVDPSYEATKAIFKLYYVLAWLPVCYSAAWRGDPSQRAGVIRYFEHFIDGLCKE